MDQDEGQLYNRVLMWYTTVLVVLPKMLVCLRSTQKAVAACRYQHQRSCVADVHRRSPERSMAYLVCQHKIGKLLPMRSTIVSKI